MQEIFQDTTLNFYRESETAPPSPVELRGVDYWNPVPAKSPTTGEAPKKDPRKPVDPLLSKLAYQADINFLSALLLTDYAKGIIGFIANFPKPLGVSDSPPKRSDRFKGRTLAAL